MAEQQNQSPNEKIEIDPSNNIQNSPAIALQTPATINIDQNFQTTEGNFEIDVGKEVPPVDSKDILGKGQPSLFGTALLLANMCFGSVVFSFGKSCKYSGMVWILVINFVGALINCWTILRLVRVSTIHNENNYAKLATKVCGNVGGMTIEIFSLLYDLIVLLSEICNSLTAVGRFSEVIFFNGKYEKYDDFKSDVWSKAKYKYSVVAVITVILFPICIIRDYTRLQFTGFIGVGCTAFCILVVVIQCNEYYNHYRDYVYISEDDSTHPNYIDIRDGFTNKLEFFKSFANLFFAYTLHNGVLSVYADFENSEKGFKNFSHSVYLGMLVVSGIHTIAIIVCFLTEPINPEDLIIFRRPIHSGYDVLMSIAKVAFFLAQIVTVPPYFLLWRQGIENIFNHKKPFSLFANIVFTAITLIVCGIVTSAYDKILNYMSYSGGFLCIVFAYFFPILMWIKSNGKGYFHWQNILEAIGAFLLCSVGIIAGVTTIVNDIQGD